MGYCKDPFHMNRQAKKGMKHMETIFKIGAGLATAAAREVKAQQREHARQQAAQQRFLLQEERNRLRLIKDNEAAMRRAERERAKAERERQRLAVQQAALEAQERLEAEIAQIEEENELWTNVHSYSNSIVTVEDINQELIISFTFNQLINKLINARLRKRKHNAEACSKRIIRKKKIAIKLQPMKLYLSSIYMLMSKLLMMLKRN